MHYVRHDYLPKMCEGCVKAAKCLGGCREAARVFAGSPIAPDPLFRDEVSVRRNRAEAELSKTGRSSRCVRNCNVRNAARTCDVSKID